MTLFYRAGVKSIVAEIIRANDKFTIKDGMPSHEYDVFTDRGEAKGAYVIIELQTWGRVSKVMSKAEILEIAKKFSKSYSTFGPWSEGQDPQLWMWKKTVLKQAAKLVPKNETIYRAIDEDNKDSVIADRLDSAKEESKSLTMGNLLKDGNNQKENENKDESEDIPNPFEGAESDENKDR